MNTNVKHKRKWLIVAVILLILLLSLPKIIGHLLYTQVSPQLTLLGQTPEWQTGWWSSKADSLAASGTRLQLHFQHGPLWLNPIGVGISQWHGTLSVPGIPALPLNGQLGLGTGYQINQTIPSNYLQRSNQWQVSSNDQAAQLQLLGSLSSTAIQANAQLPQGQFSPEIWQLDWQDLFASLSLTEAAMPLIDGQFELRAKQLNWQSLINRNQQHSIQQLSLKLAWPKQTDISAQLNASNIDFIGQTQSSGAFMLNITAESIDRIALQQWLSIQQQPNPNNAMALLAAASLLARQPEITIDQLNLQTPQGAIDLTASFRLKPKQREAKVNGSMSTLAAEWLAQAIWVDKSVADEQLQALISDGVLRRSGDQLVIDLVVNL